MGRPTLAYPGLDRAHPMNFGRPNRIVGHNIMAQLSPQIVDGMDRLIYSMRTGQPILIL
ncbi:hypothetical protein TorRG33x02_347470, partial [Trema orientale]